jgi:hypothetical protein
MSIVEKLESWQAFILPQREMNHKCREVDMRGAFRSRMTTELIQLTNQPKTVVVVTVISVVPIAASGTSVTRVVVPRPTPQNTERAGRFQFVPFIHAPNKRPNSLKYCVAYLSCWELNKSRSNANRNKLRRHNNFPSALPNHVLLCSPRTALPMRIAS